MGVWRRLDAARVAPRGPRGQHGPVHARAVAPAAVQQRVPRGAIRPSRRCGTSLYEAGADLVLNGHEHDYERFAPQDPAGNADPARGLTEIVAGTGGAALRSFGPALPNDIVAPASRTVSWC